ncbi:hypothetical protein [Achromobacter insuavis]|uniref:Uncharacterized protein n=1 Tax=Achromobacter insuavis AXX-A TaxID=1003200 RepID=F7T3E6_9BURK|nr:hypothetical protein [Achromobacter insuavis]EGP45166.1 hypothetical protein AXXA_17386 [Achromobacter insuavis AXX-A]
MPVLRPRGVVALPGLGLAAAAASLVTAGSWHGTAWTAGAVLMSVALAAGLLHSTRRSPSPVSAVRTAAGGGRWQVRLPGGWRDAALVQQRRGLAWLSLTLQPLPPGSMAFNDHNVTFTVWQPTLRSDDWRRLCLLAGAARQTPRTVRLREAT